MDGDRKRWFGAFLSLAVVISVLAAIGTGGGLAAVLQPPGCDFDNDSYEDLATGAPQEDLWGVTDAGAVHIVYGSIDGLAAVGNQRWHRGVAGVSGSLGAGDQFGLALACGNFNGDEFDDLAIGVPFDDVWGLADAGAVNVLYGSPTGLTSFHDQVWHRGNGLLGALRAGDRVGGGLAAGNFNGDGWDDLAIGAARDDVGGVPDAGAVDVLHGTADGLAEGGRQLWHRDIAGVAGVAAPSDQFGASLAAGDFDFDGNDDLAIGVPFDDVAIWTDAGSVNVLYGSVGGLTAAGGQFWQFGPDIDTRFRRPWCPPATCWPYLRVDDLFGYSLAGGDFNGDMATDLAIGVPGYDLTSADNAGAVLVLYGEPVGGLTASGYQKWHRNVRGIVHFAQDHDYYGFSVGGANFNGDDFDDLAIGVPGGKIGCWWAVDGCEWYAGVISVMYGSEGPGLTVKGDQLWHRGKPGMVPASSSLSYDQFGYAVAGADYDGSGHDDLTAGAPHTSPGGVVVVIHGGPTALAAGAGPGNQVWDQGPLLDKPEGYDFFGSTLASRDGGENAWADDWFR